MESQVLYKRLADRLAIEVNRKLFNNTCSWHWQRCVGGDVYCDFEGSDDNAFLNIDEMALIVEHRMSHGEFTEWCDANLHLDRDSAGYIELYWWLRGVRRSMITDQ